MSTPASPAGCAPSSPGPIPGAAAGDAIVIDNDGKDTPAPICPEPMDWSRMDRDEALDRICRAGITSMGGRRQLHPPAPAPGGGPGGHPDRQRRRVRALSDRRPPAAAGEGDQVLQGVQMMARLLRVERAVLVVVGDKLNAVEFWAPPAPEEAGGGLLTIQTRYPLGMEKQLIRTVTGREVPPGQSALDVKCSVFNVATVYMVRSALMKGPPDPPGGDGKRRRGGPAPESLGSHRDPLRCLLESVGGLREEPAVIPHRRSHDRDGAGEPGGPGGEEHQRPAVSHRPGAQFRQSDGDGVRPLRPLCLQLPHEPEPGVGLPGHADGGRNGFLSFIWRDCMECGCCSISVPPISPGGPGPPGQTASKGREASRNEPERTCDPPVIPADRLGIQHLLHDAGCDRGPFCPLWAWRSICSAPGAGPDPGVSGGLCGGGVRLPPSDGAEQYGGRPVRLCHRPAAGHEPPGDRSYWAPVLGGVFAIVVVKQFTAGWDGTL